jgi:hypothetical protein
MILIATDAPVRLSTLKPARQSQKMRAENSQGKDRDVMLCIPFVDTPETATTCTPS